MGLKHTYMGLIAHNGHRVYKPLRSPKQTKNLTREKKKKMIPSKLLSSLSSLSLTPFPWAPPYEHCPHRRRRLILPPVRMGGGPRTFPGGVNKWQWKRMQAKKSKQLLKARLLRERQMYEMRKRAELKAAISDLEKPWDLVQRKAPTLFSVSADEQVKALADRFQKPGGFDMWSERDGPRVLDCNGLGLPSDRFFPKGVVHSVRPYGVVAGRGGSDEESFDDWVARGGGGVSRRRRRRRDRSEQGVRENVDEDSDCIDVEGRLVGEGEGRSRGDGGNRDGKITLRASADLSLDKEMGRLGNLGLGGNGENLGRRGGNHEAIGEKLSTNGLSFDLESERVGISRSSYGYSPEGNEKNLATSRRRGRNHLAYGGRATLRPTTELSCDEDSRLSQTRVENSKAVKKVDGRRNLYSLDAKGNGKKLDRNRWRGESHQVNGEKMSFGEEDRERGGALGSDELHGSKRRNSYSSGLEGNGKILGTSRWGRRKH